MLKIVAMGTKDFIIGFSSAGVETYEVSSQEAKHKIAQLIVDDETGIILVGESTAISIISYIEKVSSTKTIPSILVLRDEMLNTGLGEKSIKKYIEQATGMKSIIGE